MRSKPDILNNDDSAAHEIHRIYRDTVLFTLVPFVSATAQISNVWKLHVPPVRCTTSTMMKASPTMLRHQPAVNHPTAGLNSLRSVERLLAISQVAMSRLELAYVLCLSALLVAAVCVYTELHATEIDAPAAHWGLDVARWRDEVLTASGVWFDELCATDVSARYEWLQSCAAKNKSDTIRASSMGARALTYPSGKYLLAEAQLGCTVALPCLVCIILMTLVYLRWSNAEQDQRNGKES